MECQYLPNVLFMVRASNRLKSSVNADHKYHSKINLFKIKVVDLNTLCHVTVLRAMDRSLRNQG